MSIGSGDILVTDGQTDRQNKQTDAVENIIPRQKGGRLLMAFGSMLDVQRC